MHSTGVCVLVRVTDRAKGTINYIFLAQHLGWIINTNSDSDWPCWCLKSEFFAENMFAFKSSNLVKTPEAVKLSETV